MRNLLEGLSEYRRRPASTLDLTEVGRDHLLRSQRLSKDPAGGNGILHGEIDSHATDR